LGAGDGALLPSVFLEKDAAGDGVDDDSAFGFDGGGLSFWKRRANLCGADYDRFSGGGGSFYDGWGWGRLTYRRGLASTASSEESGECIGEKRGGFHLGER